VPLPDSDAADRFQPLRPGLVRLAYRMLGSISEAEDVVQEAYIRWHQTDRSAIREPGAFLSKTVTRLCLDILKSARVKRETYIGPWLPEPVLETAEADEMIAACQKHDVKLALAHQTRYSPKLQVLKDFIGSGGLGEILELRGRGKEDPRGGAEDLWVLGSHVMNLINFFGGGMAGRMMCRKKEKYSKQMEQTC